MNNDNDTTTMNDTYELIKLAKKIKLEIQDHYKKINEIENQLQQVEKDILKSIYAEPEPVQEYPEHIKELFNIETQMERIRNYSNPSAEARQKQFSNTVMKPIRAYITEHPEDQKIKDLEKSYIPFCQEVRECLRNYRQQIKQNEAPKMSLELLQNRWKQLDNSLYKLILGLYTMVPAQRGDFARSRCKIDNGFFVFEAPLKSKTSGGHIFLLEDGKWTISNERTGNRSVKIQIPPELTELVEKYWEQIPEKHKTLTRYITRWSKQYLGEQLGVQSFRIIWSNCSNDINEVNVLSLMMNHTLDTHINIYGRDLTN